MTGQGLGGVEPSDHDQRLRDLWARTLLDGGGDRRAARELCHELTPVIQTRVVRVLLRRSASARGRPIRQEVEDLAQHVWVRLFANGARKLRAWDPARGLSLERFVGLVAENEAVSAFRSKGRPWTDEPTEVEELAPRLVERRTPEARAASRQEVAALYARLQEALTPKGLRLFELLIVEGLASKEAAAIMDMTANAIDQWRLRLRRTVLVLREEILSDRGTAPRSSDANRPPDKS